MTAHAIKNRVLIVDDVPENIRVIEHILQQAGDYAVAAALNGEKAIRMARKIRPDVILLDIVMDGFGVGGADYITKPVNQAELLARVRTHIALKRAHDAVRESERRYRAVVEDMTERVCRFRPDGQLVFVNEACCRHFGKSRAAFQEMAHTEDRKTLLAHYNAAVSAPAGPAQCAARFFRRSGDVYWLDVRFARVFHQETPAVQMSLMDITRVKDPEAPPAGDPRMDRGRLRGPNRSRAKGRPGTGPVGHVRRGGDDPRSPGVYPMAQKPRGPAPGHGPQHPVPENGGVWD